MQNSFKSKYIIVSGLRSEFAEIIASSEANQSCKKLDVCFFNTPNGFSRLAHNFLNEQNLSSSVVEKTAESVLLFEIKLQRHNQSTKLMQCCKASSYALQNVLFRTHGWGKKKVLKRNWVCVVYASHGVGKLIQIQLSSDDKHRRKRYENVRLTIALA